MNIKRIKKQRKNLIKEEKRYIIEEYSNNEEKYPFFSISYSIYKNKCHISYFGFLCGDSNALKEINKTGYASKRMEKFIKYMSFKNIDEINLFVSSKKILISRKENNYIKINNRNLVKWYEKFSFIEKVYGSEVMLLNLKK